MKFKLLPIVLALFLLFTGIAAAAIYHHVTTVSLTVTEGVSDVRTYSDAAGTQEWLDLDIASIEVNHAYVETMYVKNQGSANVKVGLKAQGNTAFGMVMFAPSGMFTLVPGEVMPVEVSIYIMPDAVAGVYGFSIIVYE